MNEKTHSSNCLCDERPYGDECKKICIYRALGFANSVEMTYYLSISYSLAEKISLLTLRLDTLPELMSELNAKEAATLSNRLENLSEKALEWMDKLLKYPPDKMAAAAALPS